MSWINLSSLNLRSNVLKERGVGGERALSEVKAPILLPEKGQSVNGLDLKSGLATYNVRHQQTTKLFFDTEWF